MNFVKAFGLFARLVNHFHRPNPKAAADNSIDYFSGASRADRVGFDNCEGKISCLICHLFPQMFLPQFSRMNPDNRSEAAVSDRRLSALIRG
jgi:hypothetical protein